VLCLLLHVSGTAQSVSRLYVEAEEALRVDSLRAMYGQHKRLPKDCELQALLALSHYPELRGERIRFRTKRAKLPYSARPAPISLLPFARRRYVLTISTASTDVRMPTLLQNLTFHSQIGALGHELAHIAWYVGRKKREVLGEGIRYVVSKKYKAAYERQTDRIALGHGLGPYLHRWCMDVYPTKLRDGNRWKTYYSPAEIWELMGADRRGQR
jgi:hypothetical protein